MGRKLKAQAVILAALVWAPAHAMFDGIKEEMNDLMTPGFYNGNELYEQRTTRPVFVGYVVGVYDARKFRRTFCAPEKATGGQLADVVEQFLRDNPARRADQAHSLVEAAFRGAWPCPKQAP